jgi:AraC-like DNA-binding protein
MRVDLMPVPSVLFTRLSALGVDVDPMLRIAGLARSRFNEPRARVTTSEFFALWRALARVADSPDIGLRLGASPIAHQYDVVSAAALHSPTLGDALRTLARYKRVVCPESVRILVKDGEARICFIWELADSKPPELLIDATFTSTLRLAGQGTGHPVLPKRVELTRPRSNEELLHRHIACPVRFDAPVDLLVLEESALAEPFVTHNSDLVSMLVPGLENELQRTEPRSFSDDVRAELRQSMAGRRPSLERTAKALGVSSRTLQRRLEGEGETYQHLLDEVRQRSALELLSRTDIEAEEVAFLLGFEEMNSFSRAFHDWQGRTPKQWREGERKPQ